MWTANAAFNTENANPNKEPCIVVIFEEQDGATDFKYCSNTFNDIDDYYKQYVKDFSHNSGDWSFENAIVSKEFCKFTLIDKNNEIISLLNSNIIRRKNVTIKLGYSALNIADFVTLPTFIITKVSVSSDLIAHIFTCEENDIFAEIYSEYIYTTYQTNTLSVDETSTDTFINVNNIAGFIDPASLPDGMRIACIMINSEIIKYSSIVGNTFTGCSRGYAGSTKTTHSIDDEVRQIFVLSETFAQILLRVLTSTSGGTNGRYDLGIDGIGAGIDYNYIDIESIERLGYRYHAFTDDNSQDYAEEYDYFLIKKRKLSDVIKELLNPFNAVLYKDLNENLNIKVLDLPDIIRDFSTESLSNDKITNFSDMDNFLFSNINYKYDYLPTTAIFANDNDYENDNVVTAYSNYPELKYENKGLRDWTTRQKFEHTRDRKFIFYGNLFYELTINTFLSNVLYELLDSVKINSFACPNYYSNNRTFTNEYAMIKNKSLSFSKTNFIVKYKLILFELVNKATGLYTSRSDTSFNRNTISYNADWTLALNAEDGYWRPGSSELDSYDYFYAKLTLTMPNNAAGVEHWVHLGLMVQAPAIAGWAIQASNRTKIRYNSGWNGDIVVWIPCIGIDETSVIGQIKVELMERSTTNAAHLPTAIVWNELRSVKRNFTVT